MNEGDTEAEVKATRGFNSIDPYLQRQIIAVANSECLTYPQRISKLSSWQDVIPTSTWDQLLGDKLTTSGSFYPGSTNALH